MPKNVQKVKARPKRSTAKPAKDRDLGLWVDYDLLRKHQGRPSQIVIHNPTVAANNRYLTLADIALGNKSKNAVGSKSKKKSKSATT